MVAKTREESYLNKTIPKVLIPYENEMNEAVKPKYNRILLKMSGEAFGHGGQTGISLDETINIAKQIKKVHEMGVEIAIVVGGGNILRGAQFSAQGEIIDKVTADHMGMLATIINGLALMETLEKIGLEVRLMSSLRVDSVAEFYIRRRAIRHLEKKRIVILAGGTGNPNVTTDTAAANRGVEIKADVLLKATRVDGIYTEDPEKNPHAVRYDHLTFKQVLDKQLKVMDLQGIATCQQHNLPILVFNYKKEGNIERAVLGHPIGTMVTI